MLKIDSPKNETFRKLESLTTAKGLKKEGLFLLSGEKLIQEFLEKPYLEIKYEITTSRLKPLTNSPLLQLSTALFDELDVLGTKFNILALVQPKMTSFTPETLLARPPKGLEVVLPLGDPSNLGALLRSCEAFGVSQVHLTKEAAHPFLPKSVKASAGSVLRLPLARGPALSEFPSSCIALDATGTSLYEFTWPKNAMLVVGEEGVGLGNKAQFVKKLAIPTGRVESLNVVVAASIALADRMRRL